MSVGGKHFAWLVEYAVDLLNKVQLGKDGKSAFERLRVRGTGTKSSLLGQSVWLALVVR